MRRSLSTYLIGAVIVVVYAAVAALTFRSGLLPIRPIYEGNFPPAPYLWVNPPSDIAPQNVPPQPGTGELPLRESGSAPGSVQTPDNQAIFLPGPDVFPPREGQTAVKMTITPLDPAATGPPPDGFLYDGNAYRFEAAYVPSGDPAEPTCPNTVCPTVLLRYPFTASQVFRQEPTGWAKLTTTRYESQLQVAGDTDRLGTFVATHVPGAKRSPANFIALMMGIGALLGGTMLAARRARRRDTPGKGRPPSRPGKGKRRPPPKGKKMRSLGRWLRS